MARVRLAIGLVLFLLVAGVVYTKWDARRREQPEAETPPAAPDALFPGRWGQVRFQNVSLNLPLAFGEKQDHGTHQRLYFGPEVDGFRPQVQIIQVPLKRPGEVWVAREIAKRKEDRTGRYRFVEEGPARLPGRFGRYMIYVEKSRASATGPEREFTTIAWLWTGDGRGYTVRGLAEQPSFVAGFRRFFQQVITTARVLKP